MKSFFGKGVAALVLLFSSQLILAMEQAVIPFTAVYQLDSRYALAPSISITHEVTQNRTGFRSRMEASVQLASWREQATFSLDGLLPVSMDFRSRSRVIRNQTDRSLSFAEREATTYDRQTVVFLLPALATRDGAGSSGYLNVLNPRGRNNDIEYRVVEITRFQGMNAAVIDVWFEDEPEQTARVHFSLDVPGLVLQAEAYDEKGQRLGRLQLRRWSAS
ncbi:hypothetical protein [Marinospirillum alkaliphilum]|uniref:DUF3108 domain-containing protein n=1 Tax=Marinospirillum alkaliphilum DSM 21637 TaxID=1122209 RepID=A0A1K1XLJ5_9GAMM|nr:hypothetical protein [Marinospirillum alkaliphilum]SFX49941.1 hypothetical protein SAMN02745752_01880 [Marinospirillum alkaliphilum DSM 21637]